MSAKNLQRKSCKMLINYNQRCKLELTVLQKMNGKLRHHQWQEWWLLCDRICEPKQRFPSSWSPSLMEFCGIPEFECLSRGIQDLKRGLKSWLSGNSPDGRWWAWICGSILWTSLVRTALMRKCCPTVKFSSVRIPLGLDICPFASIP